MSMILFSKMTWIPSHRVRCTWILSMKLYYSPTDLVLDGLSLHFCQYLRACQSEWEGCHCRYCFHGLHDQSCSFWIQLFCFRTSSCQPDTTSHPEKGSRWWDGGFPRACPSWATVNDFFKSLADGVKGTKKPGVSRPAIRWATLGFKNSGLVRPHFQHPREICQSCDNWAFFEQVAGVTMCR